MFRKIKIDSDQYNTIMGLAKDMGESEKEIAYDLIELGIMCMITSRKSLAEGGDGLENVVNDIRNAIENDDQMSRMSQLLEKYWDAGQCKS